MSSPALARAPHQQGPASAYSLELDVSPDPFGGGVYQVADLPAMRRWHSSRNKWAQGPRQQPPAAAAAPAFANSDRLALVLKLAVGGLAVVLLAQVAMLTLLGPALQVRNVVVYSDLPLSSIDLQQMAGLEPGARMLTIRTEVLEQRLAGFSIVHQASVTKQFPDTLHITVVARRPVGILLVQQASGMVSAAFDRDGVIFPLLQPIDQLQVPVLSGVRISGSLEGATLPPAMLPLLEGLAELQTSAPGLLKLVSEVEVHRRDSAGLELVLYPTYTDVAVRLTDRLDADTLRYAFLMLDMLEARGLAPGVGEIDFRTGEVVYTSDADTAE